MQPRGCYRDAGGSCKQTAHDATGVALPFIATWYQILPTRRPRAGATRPPMALPRSGCCPARSSWPIWRRATATQPPCRALSGCCSSVGSVFAAAGGARE